MDELVANDSLQHSASLDTGLIGDRDAVDLAVDQVGEG